MAKVVLDDDKKMEMVGTLRRVSDFLESLWPEKLGSATAAIDLELVAKDLEDSVEHPLRFAKPKTHVVRVIKFKDKIKEDLQAIAVDPAPENGSIGVSLFTLGADGKWTATQLPEYEIYTMDKFDFLETEGSWHDKEVQG